MQWNFLDRRWPLPSFCTFFPKFSTKIYHLEYKHSAMIFFGSDMTSPSPLDFFPKHLFWECQTSLMYIVHVVKYWSVYYHLIFHSCAVELTALLIKLIVRDHTGQVITLNNLKKKCRLKATPVCLREDIKRKYMFSFGHCPKRGGGYPCPNFLALFLQ